MKQRSAIILIIAGTILSAYGAWYAFTFVSPASGFAVVAIYALILIFLPYNKLKKQ